MGKSEEKSTGTNIIVKIQTAGYGAPIPGRDPISTVNYQIIMVSPGKYLEYKSINKKLQDENNVPAHMYLYL